VDCKKSREGKNSLFGHTFWFFPVLCIFLLICQPVYALSNLTYQLHGVQGDELKNVQDRLNKMQNKYGEYLSSRQARQVYVKGKVEIKKGLQPFGLFRIKIYSQLFRQQGKWIADYSIIPGEPLRVTGINVEVKGPGENDPAIHEYIHHLPLKPDNIFTVPAYNAVKKELFNVAKNRGYLRASYKNKIIVDLHRYTCRIYIRMETGPQFYFDEVWFKTHPYSGNFMRRFIDFKPGDVFSSNKLIELQQDMEQSYYFRRVVFKPNFTNPEQTHIPIDTYLYPPLPNLYGLGIGYGTLTGARISGELSLRHLGNEGHHLEAEMKLSSVLSGAAVTYYIPGRNPLTDQWFTGVNVKHFEPRMGRSHSATLLAGYAKTLEKWQGNLSLNYLVERFFIFNSPTQMAHLFFPSGKLSYIDTDDWASPHKALAANLTLQGASKSVFSKTSFVQANTHAKFIFSPFGFSRILVRGDFGYTTVHNLPVLPLSLQFVTGGVTSIRGFADSSIGPGKYLVIGSVEYQHRLKGDLYGAVFYDAGYATNHFNVPLNRGAGVGAVYDTKVGPIKLYLSRALSKHSQPFSVEFSVGPEFS